jgi:MerR family mercuric resistance operon transcriptional regulator
MLQQGGNQIVYERVGLLPRPPRSAGRYRLYDTGDVRRLAFVRRARELGFTLDEVRALLVLSAANSENTCSEVRGDGRPTPVCGY